MPQALIANRAFWALWSIQSTAAFANSLFKAMLAILFVFHIYPHDPAAAAAAATAIAAANAAPHFLCAPLAGQIGDRIERARLARIIRGADCALMVMAAFAVSAASVPALLLIVAAAGARATFFSPLKYAILPHIVAAPKLMLATGNIQGAMAVAAIGGQASAVALTIDGSVRLVLLLSFAAFVACFLLPRVDAPKQSRPIDWNPFSGIAAMVRRAATTPGIRFALFGISLAEALGALLLGQISPLVRHTLNGGPTMVLIVVGIAAAGTLAGAIASGRLAHIDRAMRILPWMMLAAALALADLAWRLGSAPSDTALSAWWARLAIDILLIGAASGFAAAPLHTLLQASGDDAYRASYAATNNVVNAVAVLAVTGSASAMLAAGVPSRALIAAAAGLIVLIAVALLVVQRRAAPPA